LRALLDYSWPGNARELRNAIERAVALCAGPVIQPEDLPPSIRPPATPPPADPVMPVPEGTLSQAKATAEAARIVAALHRHNNNRQRAAAELGISRMTLYKKLYRYGLLGGST
jgi:DNA-binding NtrC family response regulator